jgi:adenosylmethionine-8-amino-7-oxononanoate aminotransferase
VKIREICDRHGILLIADEIMSGFGRTGALFAVDHWTLTPDILVCGKGLGSGYVPIFATILRDGVMEVVSSKPFVMPLGNTYNANPLSCAIGLAVLDYTRDHDLVSRAERSGRRLRAGLAKLEGIGIVGDVRGLGLMQGVEFVRNQESREAFPPQASVAARVASAAVRAGLLLTHRGSTSDGARGDTVFVTPPLTITDDELDSLVDLLVASVSTVADEIASAIAR